MRTRDAEKVRLRNTLPKQAIAIEALATRAGALRLRLLRAIGNISVLSPNEFPPGRLRDLFESIMQRMTRKGDASGSNRLAMTAHTLAGVTAKKIAEDIVALYTESVAFLLDES